MVVSLNPHKHLSREFLRISFLFKNIASLEETTTDFLSFLFISFFFCSNPSLSGLLAAPQRTVALIANFYILYIPIFTHPIWEASKTSILAFFSCNMLERQCIMIYFTYKFGKDLDCKPGSHAPLLIGKLSCNVIQGIKGISCKFCA